MQKPGDGKQHTPWCSHSCQHLFQILMLEKSWKSPGARRLNQSILKEINPEYSLMLTNAPILWPPDAKSQLIGRDSDAGKDWGQEEKGMTENEMVGLYHWLNEHQSEQTQGGSEGQGCYSPWGSQRVGHALVTEQQQPTFECLLFTVLSTNLIQFNPSNNFTS